MSFNLYLILTLEKKVFNTHCRKSRYKQKSTEQKVKNFVYSYSLNLNTETIPLSLPFINFSKLPFGRSHLFKSRIDLTVDCTNEPSILCFLRIHHIIKRSLQMFSVKMPTTILHIKDFTDCQSLPPPHLPSDSVFAYKLSAVSYLPWNTARHYC